MEEKPDTPLRQIAREALALAEKTPRPPGDPPRIWLILAQHWEKAGDPERAQQALTRGLALFQAEAASSEFDVGRLWFARELAYWDKTQAETVFHEERAKIEQEPDAASARHDLWQWTDSWGGMGHEEEARAGLRTLAQEAYEAGERESAVYHNILSSLIALSDYDTVIGWLSRIDDPGDRSRLRCHIAQTLKDNPDRALQQARIAGEESLQVSLTWNPGREQAQVVETLLHLEQKEEARRFAQRAERHLRKTLPDDLSAFAGEIALARGDLRRGLPYLRQSDEGQRMYFLLTGLKSAAEKRDRAGIKRLCEQAQSLLPGSGNLPIFLLQSELQDRILEWQGVPLPRPWPRRPESADPQAALAALRTLPKRMADQPSPFRFQNLQWVAEAFYSA